MTEKRQQTEELLFEFLLFQKWMSQNAFGPMVLLSGLQNVGALEDCFLDIPFLK